MLGITPPTMRKYAREGIVPSIHVGGLFRFERAALRKWIADQAKKSPHPVTVQTAPPTNGHTNGDKAPEDEVAKTYGNAAFRRIFRPWLLAPEQIAHLKARALVDDAVFIQIIHKCFSTPASVKPESEGTLAINVLLGAGGTPLKLPYAPAPALPPASNEPSKDDTVETISGNNDEAS